MKDRKPNHICRNPNCHKGEDGGRKHYYACDFCDRTNQWRAFTCSIECFKEFAQVSKTPSTKPERTDKTESEMKELMSKPIEQVKNETLKDLEDMKEVVDEKGIVGAIEEINQVIDSKPKTNTRGKKKKS